MPRPDPEPGLYDFRTVDEADCDLLANWIAQPHWAQWWGDPDKEIAEIRTHIDSVSVEPLIVELDGAPIAYLQSYDPHLEDDHPYADQPFGTLGVDLSIGPEEMLGIGHGTAILTQFMEELFEEGTVRVIIDPDPANARAIRSYTKAGFRPLEERKTIYGHVLLMACDSPEADT